MVPLATIFVGKSINTRPSHNVGNNTPKPMNQIKKFIIEIVACAFNPRV